MCVVAMLPCRWLRTVCYQNALAQRPGHFKLFKCSSSDKCVLLCSIGNFHTRPKQFESLHAWLQVESPHEDHGHSRCVRYCSQVRSTEVYFDDSMTLLYFIVSRCHNTFQRSGWRWFCAKAGCASYQCLTCFYNFLSSQVHRGTPERLTPSTLLRHGILVSVDSTMMPPVICKPLTLGHALSNSPSQFKKILATTICVWMPECLWWDYWIDDFKHSMNAMICHVKGCQRFRSDSAQAWILWSILPRSSFPAMLTAPAAWCAFEILPGCRAREMGEGIVIISQSIPSLNI